MHAPSSRGSAEDSQIGFLSVSLEKHGERLLERPVAKIPQAGAAPRDLNQFRGFKRPPKQTNTICNSIDHPDNSSLEGGNRGGWIAHL